MDQSRVAIVIPAYNEAATIFDIVSSTSSYGQPIVVNDSSMDTTAQRAEQAGAIVVTHKSNMGYDGALNTGFAEAYSRGFDTIITLDADGQHDPSLLIRFIQEIENGADLVLGVRNRRPRLAEHIFALYTRVKYGIQDPLCGMKAYRRTVYESLGYFDSYKSIGTELALYGIKKKYKFSQIHFVVKDRIDQPRFGRLISANIRIFRAMILDLCRL